MQELILDYVKYLSIVDNPAVEDAQFLVTKRHESEDNTDDTMTDSDNTETDDEIVVKDEVAKFSEQLSAMNDRLDSLESELATDDTEPVEQTEAVEEATEERYTLAELEAITDVVSGLNTTPEAAATGDVETENAPEDETSKSSETKRKGHAGDPIGAGESGTYTKSTSGKKVKDLTGAIERAQRGGN